MYSALLLSVTKQAELTWYFKKLLKMHISNCIYQHTNKWQFKQTHGGETQKPHSSLPFHKIQLKGKKSTKPTWKRGRIFVQFLRIRARINHLLQLNRRRWRRVIVFDRRRRMSRPSSGNAGTRPFSNLQGLILQFKRKIAAPCVEIDRPQMGKRTPRSNDSC